MRRVRHRFKVHLRAGSPAVWKCTIPAVSGQNEQNQADRCDGKSAYDTIRDLQTNLRPAATETDPTYQETDPAGSGPTTGWQ